MCCCFISDEENQEQVPSWEVGSREPSRTDHLSPPWLGTSSLLLSPAVALTHTSCFSSSLGIMY